jgi:hypothetical protein
MLDQMKAQGLNNDQIKQLLEELVGGPPMTRV